MRKLRCAGMALMSLFFLVMSIGPASAVDEYVYGTTYFTITLSYEISDINAYDKGMEWMKWNWTTGAAITECVLYEDGEQIEKFNTTLETYNSSFLKEGKEYNLACRGYTGAGAVSSWSEVVASTEAILDKTIINFKILKNWLIRLLGIGDAI